MKSTVSQHAYYLDRGDKMSVMAKALVSATVIGLALFVGAESARAQDIERTWQSSPSGGTWHLEHVGTVDGVQQYTFTYEGFIISGGGDLELHPDGFIRAKATSITRDNLGQAIPVGTQATGRMTENGTFYLDGFQLDGMAQRLSFY